LGSPIEVSDIFDIFINEFLHDISGVHIDNDQSLKGNTFLIKQVSSHQLHNIFNLLIQLILVRLKAIFSVLFDSLLDLSRPVSRIDGEYNLTGPLTDPGSSRGGKIRQQTVLAMLLE
jgi:hypothetical protein